MNKILVLGETPSQKDMDKSRIFSCPMAGMLKAVMRKVGFEPQICEWDNVLREHYTWNQIVGPKAAGIPNMKPVGGKYVLARHEAAVRECWDRINRRQPSVIIALGDLAMWATTSHSSIEAARGRISQGHAGIPGLKVMPTYAPRTIAAEYKKRPIWFFDLDGALRESRRTGFHRPQRFIHLEPTLADMEEFFNEYIAPCTTLSVDIEVKGYKEGLHSISCVGFAPSTTRALVVPFFSEETDDGNYWPTVRDELLAWSFVRRVLRCGKETGGQNYQYERATFVARCRYSKSRFYLGYNALRPRTRTGTRERSRLPCVNLYRRACMEGNAQSQQS